MKKKIIILTLIACVFGVWIFITGQKRSEQSDNTVPNKNVTVIKDDIVYSWTKVSDLSKISLYPNYTEQLRTDELIKKYNCSSLINGGFYSKLDKPLGLFVTNGNTLSSAINSSLFNGFFIIDNNQTRITYNKPGGTPTIALQTGPVLFFDGEPVDLRLIRDTQSRRSVAVVTKDRQVIFMSIYNKGSVFTGPKLDDLPLFLNKIEAETGYEFQSAINLDGGSASAFITKDANLEELVHIGSFFCVKD